MISKVADIEPDIWVKLKREYERNNSQPVERKTSRQHARWLRLRMILRCRWQSFTMQEREECIRLYGAPIQPPGA